MSGERGNEWGEGGMSGEGGMRGERGNEWGEGGAGGEYWSGSSRCGLHCF